MDLTHRFVIVGWIIVCSGVSLCAVLTIIQLIIQNYYSALPIRNPKRKRSGGQALVSVHVPSHNEPSKLLCNTIRALTKQTYQAYEVLILDNNTYDSKVWKPVARYCRTLGRRFDFKHIENLPGYKAAALNLLREQTNPKAEYIATIDSDYATSPNFLSLALQYFSDPAVGFVQFPQAYLNATPRNAGILLEYEYFFATYMNGANYCHAVNATGTLTVFKRDILKKIGKYDTSSITEDAEIGYRFITAGYYGVYVHQVVGRGLIPYDIADYKQQKLRWAKGNTSILRSFFTKEIFDPRLSLAQKVSLFAQLTAWLNFTLPAIVCILLYSFLSGFTPTYVTQNRWAVISLGISTLTLLAYLVLQLTAYLWRYFGQRSVLDILRAYLIRLSMHWIYATAWLRVLSPQQQHFVRTNKFITPLPPSVFRQTRIELALVAVSSLAAYWAWQQDMPWLALTNSVIAGLFSLVYYFLWEMSTTKTVSAHLLLTALDHQEVLKR